MVLKVLTFAGGGTAHHLLKPDYWNGICGIWNMFFGPKAQCWHQQGHSAPKMRKLDIRQSEKKHPTKLVKAATSCLLGPLTTTMGCILRGKPDYFI